jgi:hypothetical protein
MTVRINILVLVWVLVCLTFLAHKAFGAAPREAVGTTSVVCVGYYDKQGELVMEVCPAPKGPETVPERIIKGE